jgi:lipid-A-disaccharide synthase
MHLVDHIRNLSAMGVSAVAVRLRRLVRATVRLDRLLQEARPRAALLVGFSEFNARLGRKLRARGTRVLWYGPPQVWAWRPHRTPRLIHSADAFAVVLPFEEPIWRSHGAVVRFVGHPSTEWAPPGTPAQDHIALLPGSRDHEVRRHLLPMLHAAPELGSRMRVGLAPTLSDSVRAWAARRTLLAGGSVQNGAAEVLRGSIAAIAGSGTATVDCVVARVPPIVVYRTDPVTWSVARRYVRVPHVGLPNLVLGRAVFPELLQRAVTPTNIRKALTDVLGHSRHYGFYCERARAAISRPGRPSSHVAAMLQEWL